MSASRSTARRTSAPGWPARSRPWTAASTSTPTGSPRAGPTSTARSPTRSARIAVRSADWLSARHPSWHAVGKVCLHLAENRGDDEHPFAFLATYAVRAGAGGKVQHRPLARALEESSARGDRQALLHLLVPVAARRGADRVAGRADRLRRGLPGDGLDARRGAPLPARHPGVRGGRAGRARPRLVARRDARHGPRSPCAWARRSRARSAWTRCSTSRSPSRWATTTLTAAEVRQLLASSGGLVRLRGQWVELDRERLREVLAHWERVRREAEEGGVSFLEGMRLLAGAARTDDDAAALDGGRGLVARRGRRLARAHARGAARAGRARRRPTRARIFAARCGPIRRSAWRGSRSPRRCGSASAWPTTWGSARPSRCWASCCCTSGARGAASRRICSWRRRRCSPTGRREIERFAPSLTTLVAHPSAMPAPRARRAGRGRSRRHRSRHHDLRDAGARRGAPERASGRWSSSTRRRRSRTPGPGRRRRSRR